MGEFSVRQIKMKKYSTILIFLFGVLLFADGAFTYYKGEEFGFLGRGRGKSANMSPRTEMIAGALVILSFAFAVTTYRKKKE